MLLLYSHLSCPFLTVLKNRLIITEMLGQGVKTKKFISTVIAHVSVAGSAQPQHMQK